MEASYLLYCCMGESQLTIFWTSELIHESTRNNRLISKDQRTVKKRGKSMDQIGSDDKKIIN